MQIAGFILALVCILLLAKYRLPVVYDWPAVRTPLRDVWPEPWRHHPRVDEIRLVPTRFVERLADPNELRQIKRFDVQRTLEIQRDVWVNGFREPLILTVDPHGRVMLKDGHHRIVIATALGIRNVPLVVQQSRAISKRSLSSFDAAVLLHQFCPTETKVR